jgi:hypothetical protein
MFDIEVFLKPTWFHNNCSSYSPLIVFIFDDSLFLFDFSLIPCYLHAVCWIFTMETIDNTRIALFLSEFWWYTWRQLYLDLLFSVRYRGIETNMISWICSSNKPTDCLYIHTRSQDVLLVYLFVWQMCQGGIYI